MSNMWLKLSTENKSKRALKEGKFKYIKTEEN